MFKDYHNCYQRQQYQQYLIKSLLSFLITSAIFLFSAKNVFGQVVINEIEPYAEWVELYKTQEGEVSLEGCVIYFHNSTSTHQKKEFGSEDKFFEQEFFKKIDTDKIWLANDGDTVILVCDWGQNTLSYGQEAMVGKPPTNKSIGRYPDGSSNLFVLDEPTPGSSNSYTQPTPTLTPTSTPTSSPEPTNTPTPKPTPTSKPSTPTPTTKTATPTPTPTKTTATTTGETLGEEEVATSAFYPLEATEEAKASLEATPSFKNRWLPKIFLGLGFIFLFSAAFWVWYTQLRTKI